MTATEAFLVCVNLNAGCYNYKGDHAMRIAVQVRLRRVIEIVVGVLAMLAVLCTTATAGDDRTATAATARWDGIYGGRIDYDTSSGPGRARHAFRGLVVSNDRVVTTSQDKPWYHTGTVDAAGHVWAGLLSGGFIGEQFEGQLLVGWGPFIIFRYHLTRLARFARDQPSRFDGLYRGTGLPAPGSAESCGGERTRTLQVRRGLAWLDSDLLAGQTAPDGSVSMRSLRSFSVSLDGSFQANDFRGVMAFPRPGTRCVLNFQFSRVDGGDEFK